MNWGPVLNAPAVAKRAVHEDGKVCWSIPHHRGEKKFHLLKMEGKEFAAVYSSYDGRWYIHEEGESREVACVRDEFYQLHFAKYMISVLVPATGDNPC